MKRTTAFRLGSFGLGLALCVGTGACKKDPATTLGAGSASATLAPNTAPASAIASPLAGDFEGTIAIHASSTKGGKSGDITFHVKKDVARIDLPKGMTKESHLGGDEDVWLLVSGPEKRGYAVVAGKKMALFVDFAKVKDQVTSLQTKSPMGLPTSANKGPKPDLKKTDKKDTVAGLPCTEWEMTQKEDGKDQLVRICVADAQAGWLSSLGEKMLPDDYAFAAGLADGKHFPVRVVALEGGVETGRAELTKYTKEPVADVLLQVPADYTKTDLFDMLGSLMQLGGGGGFGGKPRGQHGGPTDHNFH